MIILCEAILFKNDVIIRTDSFDLISCGHSCGSFNEILVSLYGKEILKMASRYQIIEKNKSFIISEGDLT